MKKLITLLLLLLLSSCIAEVGENKDNFPYGNKTIQSMEFDGCEYVYMRRFGSIAITHKGNCKNHIK